MLKEIAIVCAAIVLPCAGSQSFGQNPARIPAMGPNELDQRDALLRQWSESSDGINALDGAVLRIVYENTFCTESRSIGKLSYEKPDKGFIIFAPEPVTPQILQAREKQVEDALREGKPSPVMQNRQTGKPYQLTPDSANEFWCDGKKVYEIDKDAKEAIIADLPPQLNGRNIMESPLPFFFGMPPERANRRFEIGFSAGAAPKPDAVQVQLVVFPNEPQDAQKWHHADVILNLQTYLPVAVRVYDPAQTRVTVYSFADLKVNPRSLLARNYAPSLNGLKVTYVQSGNQGAGGPPMAGVPEGNPPVVPNLKGMNHKDALQKLAQLGLTRDTQKPENSRVLVYKGNKTNVPAQVHTVETQSPAPGTPIQKDTRVTLNLLIP